MVTTNLDIGHLRKKCGFRSVEQNPQLNEKGERDYADFFLAFAPVDNTSMAFLSIKSSDGFGATNTGG